MKDKKDFYPINFDEDEFFRLDNQAKNLGEPILTYVAKNASNCLEIGCGIGSNINNLKNANPNLYYTGIDLNDTAITAAKARYSHDTSIKFEKMDALNITLEDFTYDLVVCKLVLWSVGSNWQNILKRAYSLLKRGGVLYCFEPDDHLLFCHPQKQNAQRLISAWQQKVISLGMNPFIGRDLYRALHALSWTDLTLRLHSSVTLGSTPEIFKQVSSNLKRIFTSQGPSYLGYSENDQIWIDGLEELNLCRPDDLIVENYFIAVAKK